MQSYLTLRPPLTSFQCLLWVQKSEEKETRLWVHRVGCAGPVTWWSKGESECGVHREDVSKVKENRRYNLCLLH